MCIADPQGSVQALNGLGWYYSTILRDYKTAYKYFEQAAHNGSHDGMFNLGVYHLNGKNPHNPEKNEVGPTSSTLFESNLTFKLEAFYRFMKGVFIVFSVLPRLLRFISS